MPWPECGWPRMSGGGGVVVVEGELWVATEYKGPLGTGSMRCCCCSILLSFLFSCRNATIVLPCDPIKQTVFHPNPRLRSGLVEHTKKIIMDQPSATILASLSLPGYSEAISLRMGNTVENRAKTLKSGVERSKVALEEQQPVSMVKNSAYDQVTYLKGTSASVVPVVRAYLSPESLLHGARIAGALKLPKTQRERDLAIATLTEAMENVEASAEESSDLMRAITQAIEEAKAEIPPIVPEERPGEPKVVRTPEEERIRKALEKRRKELIQSARSPSAERRVATLRQKALVEDRIITSAWKLMRRPSPESISDAIFMVLHTSEYDYGQADVPYKANTYLGEEATLIASDDISEKEWIVEKPKPRRTFSVHNLTPTRDLRIEDIKQDIEDAVTLVAPTVTFNSRKPKSIDITIPLNYVQPTVAGLPVSNRLLGFSAYVRVTVALGRKKDAATEQKHMFFASEAMHSETLPADSKLFISVTQNQIRLGTSKAPMDWPGLKASLFGTGKRPRPWRAVSANVTRVYLSRADASETYVKFQEIDLKALHRASADREKVMTFGEAANLKAQLLLDMIRDETKEGEIPIDYVTDHDIVGTDLSKST